MKVDAFSFAVTALLLALSTTPASATMPSISSYYVGMPTFWPNQNLTQGFYNCAGKSNCSTSSRLENLLLKPADNPIKQSSQSAVTQPTFLNTVMNVFPDLLLQTSLHISPTVPSALIQTAPSRIIVSAIPTSERKSFSSPLSSISHSHSLTNYEKLELLPCSMWCLPRHSLNGTWWWSGSSSKHPPRKNISRHQHLLHP